MTDRDLGTEGNPAQLEMREWLDSLSYVYEHSGPERVHQLLDQLLDHARQRGVRIPSGISTPYINTIPASGEPPYPGSRDLERQIRNIIRWNAMVMVEEAIVERAQEVLGIDAEKVNPAMF